MKPKLYDGVIESVRYTPEGQISETRMYLRRGFVYTDRMLVSRPELQELLKKRKKIVTGKRVEFMAATFEDVVPVVLAKKDDAEIIRTKGSKTSHDHLEGIPLY